MPALGHKKTTTCVVYIVFSCNLKSVKIYGKKQGLDIDESLTEEKVEVSAVFLKDNRIRRKYYCVRYTQKLAMMLSSDNCGPKMQQNEMFH